MSSSIQKQTQSQTQNPQQYIFIKCILIFILYILFDLPFLYYNADKYKKETLAISNKPYTKRYYSAVAVYVALTLGIVVLVLPHINIESTTTNKANNTLTSSIVSNIIKNSILYGGIFGLTAYATFDFTTHFMFEGWTLRTSIIDTIWGGVLSSIVTILISLINVKYLL